MKQYMSIYIYFFFFLESVASHTLKIMDSIIDSRQFIPFALQV